jgi:hypothetical protein
MASTSTRSSAAKAREHAASAPGVAGDGSRSPYDDLRQLAVEAALVTLGTTDLAVDTARSLSRRTVALPQDVARTVADLPDRLRCELNDLADRGRLMGARVQGDDLRLQEIEDGRAKRRKARTRRSRGRTPKRQATARPKAKTKPKSAARAAAAAEPPSVQ